MTIGPELQCDVCLNRLPETGSFCKAFLSEPIPEKLKIQKVLHNKPYPGDNGIMFEQNPTLPKPFER